MRRQMGAEAERLVGALTAEGAEPVSVRLNPDKPYTAPEGKAVDWCASGRYLPSRPSFTLDPHFQAGAYYVQEASSMFVGELLMQVAGPIEQGLRLLDMCAAPGGKATLYSSVIGGKGIVVANEVIRQRAAVLADNVQRWGLGNTVVCSDDPSHFAALGGWFDAVAVDAPCSGEGMFRKNPEARAEWSLENVKLCAARQKRILADAWAALKEGGVLIYSTCTFNRAENEDNMEWLSEQFDCIRTDIEIPAEWNIVRTRAGEAECFRFFPHLTRGEGLFAAVVRKGGSSARAKTPRPRRKPFGEPDRNTLKEASRWVTKDTLLKTVGDTLYAYPEMLWEDQRAVCEQMTAIYSGTRMGQVFGRTLKPDHALALSVLLDRSAAPEAGLTVEEALRYLRRQELSSVGQLAEGINLLLFEEQPIGWTKRIGQRTNNLMPKELRILQ